MSYHTALGFLDALKKEQGEFAPYKACLPDLPKVCLTGWSPFCEWLNAERIKNNAPWGTQDYFWNDACGEGRASAFAVWWIDQVWANNTNKSTYPKYPGDPPPGQYYQGTFYTVPALPGLKSVISKQDATNIAMAIMRTLVHEQKKKKKEGGHPLPLWTPYGNNTSLQERFVKVAPDLLRNFDDSVACRKAYTDSVQANSQYLGKDAALANSSQPFMPSTPPGSTQKFPTPAPYTGYCKPSLVMSVDSHGTIKPGCVVHPTCRLNEFGSVIPVPKPPPTATFFPLVFATVTPSAEATTAAAEVPPPAPGAPDAPGEEKKKLSAPALAAGVLAVGAIGIVGYVLLKKRR